MSETTLVEIERIREAWLLGHEIAANVEKALSSEEVAYYRGNKKELVHGLRHGFLLPGTIPLSAVPVEIGGFPTEETDCFEWIEHMEKFSGRYLDANGSLRDMFPIPPRLPWEKVLPIFDPGLSFRQVMDKALKAQGVVVGEGMDVMKFTGAESAGPRLWIIERSLEPKAARGLPPRFAQQWFEGRTTRPLNLGGYGIGNGLLYRVEKKFLDPEAKTASWFPENIFLPDDRVACGYCYLGSREVWFGRSDPGCGDAGFGFREAILLLPQS